MNFLKTKTMKIIAVVSAALIMCSGVSAVTYALTQKNTDTESTSTENEENKTEAPKSEVTKDETVYVLANTDGSVKKIIVSDWIKNSLDAKSVNDKTELTDIKNVKGNESYTMNGDNMRVWNADGNDIYYQGTISKELPVDLSVSYKLDGKTVTADEIAGKSGKVTIRFDYKNNQYSYVDIDGKKEKIYVPFVMLTGMLLDNDIFKNVEVTNGRVINDGSRIAVVGFALPGLQENLAIDKEKLDIPDFVEITADATKFKLSTTMTLAANNLFNEIDTGKLDSVDNLQNSLKELTTAMSQLLDGSSKLYGGLTQLLGKSGELIAGINQLSDGAGKLNEGTSSLSEGLKELVSNNENLNGGAATVFNTLLDTVTEQLTQNGVTTEKLTIANYKTVLNNLTSKPTDAQKKQLIAVADKTLEAELTAGGVPEDQMTVVKVMLCNLMAAGKTQNEAVAEIKKILTDAVTVNTVKAQGQVNTTIMSGLVASGVDTQTAGLISMLCNYLATVNSNQPAQNIDAAKAMAVSANTYMTALNDNAGQTKINAFCLAAAIKTMKPTVDNAITQLDSYNTFYQGVLAYTAGAEKAYGGSKELNSGAAQLNDGIGKLKDGGGQLVSGVQQLTDGSKELADGLKEFNEKGIRKITSLAEDELNGLVTRVKATADVSKEYKSFAGISDDADGNVKFIYKTDEIK